MMFLTLYMPVLLVTVYHTLAQNFSGYAHDCQNTGYNGDYSTVFGINCAFNTSEVAETFPKMSSLRLDGCLTFDSPNLVGHQG